MKLTKTDIEGLKIIEGFKSLDDRGLFFKFFNTESLELDFKIEEVFYSINEKDVIRGMHFQIPPYDNYKIIHVIKGSILDVVVDLRRRSNSFKKVFEINLNNYQTNTLIIPPGCAHGFKSLEHDSTIIYLSSKVYSKDYDFGINYASFNYNWNLEKPIVSIKDSNLINMEEFLKRQIF